MDQRTCIKFCVKNEIKCADAFRMLTVAYGEATLDRSNVYGWYKMFSEGREDVNDEERAGRPSSSTTDEKINEVEKMILANRRITVREVAEDLNISIGSCHSIFINDLGMRRVAAEFVPKLLNCDQKQHRMNIANEMLDSVRDDPNLLQRVITGDEAWYYGYDVETKAQSSQWKLPHEPRPKKARQVRSNMKVLLTVFFDCVVIFDKSIELKQINSTLSRMEGIKPPAEFVPYSNEKKWETWRESFEIFAIAVNLESMPLVRQRAILKHIAGEKTVIIYKTFHISENDTYPNVKEMLDMLTNHFKPFKNTIQRRNAFFTCVQKERQGIMEFVTELKHLAQECEFENLTESLIRDRLIIGILDREVKDLHKAWIFSCASPAQAHPNKPRSRSSTPAPAELLHEIPKAKYYTVLDVKSAYWHIQVAKECRDLLVMTTPFGKFRYNRLPFEPNKIDKLITFKRPEDKKSLQRIMGLYNYLGKFIPNLAASTSNIRGILRKNVVWHWGPKQDGEFDHIKECVRNAPSLAHFDKSKMLILQCDASKDAMGAALLQEDRPLAFASASFSDSQKQYSQIEKELLSVYYGCKKFEYLLSGHTFVVQTDHQPLLPLVKKPLSDISPRLQRLVMKLIAFDFKLQYKPGKYLIVADTLSRDTHPMDELPTPFLEDKRMVKMVRVNISDEKLVAMQKDTREDPALVKVIDYVIEGWPICKKDVDEDAKVFFDFRHRLYLWNDLLCIGSAIVIPKTQRNNMLNLLHQSHQGISAIQGLARESLFWPRMSIDIAEKVKNCEICQKHQKSKIRQPLKPFPVPDYPWQTVSLDIFYIQKKPHLLVVDRYSGYPEVFTLDPPTAINVKNKLRETFARFGIPETMMSDNGPPFRSEIMTDFCIRWGIKQLFSSPHLHRSNGLAERNIQTIKNQLIKCRDEGSDPYLAILAYRNTPKNDLPSPAQLCLSRSLRCQIPRITPLYRPYQTNWRSIENAKRKRQSSMKEQYDRNSKSYPKVNVGEDAWCQIHPRETWTPVKISAQADSPQSFEVVTPSGNRLIRNQQFIRPRDGGYEKSQLSSEPITASPEAQHPQCDSPTMGESSTAPIQRSSEETNIDQREGATTSAGIAPEPSGRPRFSRGVVHHKFLPQGTTVNKEYYLQVMLNLREAIRQKRPDLWKNKNWLLHDDKAPAHTSLLVRDFLAKNNTLMMPQPPYSPDLAPCDFFLFPKLKRPMKGRRYATLDEIKTASKEELKKILKNDFLKCFEDWKNRWHKTISDKTGNCTFISSRGSSVVDYFIVSYSLLEHVVDLKVDNNPYSDHLPLTINMSNLSNLKRTKETVYPCFERYRWAPDNTSLFSQNLDNNQVSTDQNLDSLVNTFSKQILNAMLAADMRIKVRPGRPKSKPWYSRECYLAKKSAKASLTTFKETNTDVDRNIYVSNRKRYTTLINFNKKKYLQEKQELLKNARDSANFWKTIATLKDKSYIQGNITILEWQCFYNKLLSAETTIGSDLSTLSPIDPELYSEISITEITREISSLANEKACGADEIPNEALKTLPFEHLVTLKNIFNRIINSGSYPLIWSKSIIHPIFKSGDRDNPSNYRGIALISNLSKLFTSILKSRLRNWIEGRSIIPENQAGFRKGYSCQDHIFTLLSLIQLTLRRKRRKLYAFFVDLKKAFDTVPHSLLWSKLGELGLDFRFVNLIRNYFEQMTTTVRWNGLFTEPIKIRSGVLQGEPLSPYLFILFIMVFRNRGRPAKSDKWFWGDQLLTVTSKYLYLGYPLTTTISFSQVASYFKGKVLAATGEVWKIMEKSRLNSFGSSMKLLDSITLSTLLYSAPIWANEKYKILDQIQNNYLRRLLNLPSNTPGYILRMETGRFSLGVTATKLILKFWLRILKMEKSRLPAICLAQLWETSTLTNTFIGFTENLMNILNSTGFMWLKNCSDPNILQKAIPQIIRITIEQSIQTDQSRITNSKLHTHYKYLHKTFAAENYLLSELPLPAKRLIAQLRILFLWERFKARGGVRSSTIGRWLDYREGVSESIFTGLWSSRPPSDMWLDHQEGVSESISD
ncbi:K02A2.6-like [Cordylochernes scorpioides]|uniref:RNA-directed DNA polymerase n=1 Tax=Cordylochernes scorpioides TaxID=51811 RepID=A0ABY6LKP3_9ARAC|nr:K02A2.6-like [Cordylochernes scorpioides]